MHQLEIIKVIMKRPILNLESRQRMIIRDPKNNPHRNEFFSHILCLIL